MSSYIGRHAQLYDIFYAEKNYAQEANFIHQLIIKHLPKSSKKLLEIACGTGRRIRLQDRCC
jgi:ubiquinone/menaquinone biosynthesis C-methylase UbiE